MPAKRLEKSVVFVAVPALAWGKLLTILAKTRRIFVFGHSAAAFNSTKSAGMNHAATSL
jgi:hypothetical protein